MRLAKLQRKSISKRTVEAFTVDKDTVYRDSELPGFGGRMSTAARLCTGAAA